MVVKNNTRTFKILGVDVFEFTPSWHVTRELMLESLKRRGDFDGSNIIGQCKMSNQVKDFLKDWLIPPGILRTISAIKHQYSLLSRNSSAVLSENARFRNLHAGKRCFVIGNGPSSNSQDLSLLKNEITYTCNAFYLHPILSQWQPTYHSHVDPNAFDGSVDMTNWFSEVCEKMPNTKFFLPLNARNNIVVNNLFPRDRTYYCDFWGRLADGVKSLDITRPIPSGQSVSIFGICLAIYMGCNPIYLLGMDHNWLATRNIETHFYEGAMIRETRVIAGQTIVPYDLNMKSILILWEGYKNIKAFAESRGIKIYNATNGGFLDVFERVKYESLFSK